MPSKIVTFPLALALVKSYIMYMSSSATPDPQTTNNEDKMKITTAAQKSLESGISNSIIRRSSGGNICQEGFCECGDGKVLEVYCDLSEPIDDQVRSAKVVRFGWDKACMEAVNS